MEKDDFRVSDYSVLIPYKDLEKIVSMSHEFVQMKAQYARLEDQYTAIRGMFSECLEKIAEIRDYVGNS